LKTQAYKKYLYGKDGKFENFLSELEDEAGRVIFNIQKTLNLPKYDSEEYENFCCLQLFLT